MVSAWGEMYTHSNAVPVVVSHAVLRHPWIKALTARQIRSLTPLTRELAGLHAKTRVALRHLVSNAPHLRGGQRVKERGVLRHAQLAALRQALQRPLQAEPVLLRRPDRRPGCRPDLRHAVPAAQATSWGSSLTRRPPLLVCSRSSQAALALPRADRGQRRPLREGATEALNRSFPRRAAGGRKATVCAATDVLPTSSARVRTSLRGSLGWGNVSLAHEPTLRARSARNSLSFKLPRSPLRRGTLGMFGQDSPDSDRHLHSLAAHSS